MPIAYWCILAAAVLAYIPAGMAKARKGSGYDNARPRETAAQLTGFSARAHGAHLNSLESLPFFGLAVLTADYLGDRPDLLDALALAYIGLRLIYIGLYLKNLPKLRSAVWGIGFLTVIAIFTLPVWG